MSIIKEYVAYLKDNPQGYWFKRKLYGWGWVPARWQGWCVLVAYIAATIYLFRRVDTVSHSASDALMGFILPFFAVSVLLLATCYFTGESPRFQWGTRVDTDDVNLER